MYGTHKGEVKRIMEQSKVRLNMDMWNNVLDRFV